MNEYRYNYTWIQPRNRHLTFKIRSCDNGHILLSNSLLDVTENAAYEIVLGGYNNTFSDIRRGAHGPIVASANTPNIMNCDEFLPFWVKWENKVLIVGSGLLGSNVIMEYNDRAMSDDLLATVTSWESAPAEFHFLESEGKNIFDASCVIIFLILVMFMWHEEYHLHVVTLLTFLIAFNKISSMFMFF